MTRFSLRGERRKILSDKNKRRGAIVSKDTVLINKWGNNATLFSDPLVLN